MLFYISDFDYHVFRISYFALDCVESGGMSKTSTCLKQVLGLNLEAYVSLGCVEIHVVLNDK
jgi:hypothetical protein